MANQFSSIANSFAILKNWYAGPIVSQFNDECPIYRDVDRGKERYNGQQVIRTIKVLRNPGIGAVADGGTLPKIGQQTTAQAIISAKYNYLRFGLTGPMIKASQGDKGAFVSAMEFEMTEGLLDLKTDVNRQLLWNGDGTLATVSANTVASTTLVVTGRESTEDGNKFLSQGMVIDIVSGGVVTNSAVQINSISGTTTATLTLSAPVTCSANDTVIRSGSLNNEVQGVLYSQDGGTSTIFNIDRSAYQQYQGNLLNNNANQMSLAVLQQALNNARRRGGAKMNAIYSDFDSERFYNKLLVPDRRYVGKSVVGDGTFVGKDSSFLEFAGVPWCPDKDSPTRVIMLDTKYWKKYVLAEIEWADETGSYLIAQTSSDTFEARLRLFFNLFPEKPAANAVLKNYVSP
jgi:hypothetical protein